MKTFNEFIAEAKGRTIKWKDSLLHNTSTATHNGKKLIIQKSNRQLIFTVDGVLIKTDKGMADWNLIGMAKAGAEKFMMEAVKPMPMEAKYHYSVYKLGMDGKISNRENLNYDEVFEFMLDQLNKWASLRVVRSDGNAVDYTDKGAGKDHERYVPIKKQKLKKGDKSIP